MLNVLHERFAANPAQNSPSHIMKGEKSTNVNSFTLGLD